MNTVNEKKSNIRRPIKPKSVLLPDGREFHFGEVVVFKNILRRISCFYIHDSIERLWIPKILDIPREGIFLGVRTLNDGLLFDGRIEEGYRPHIYYKVALVSPGPNENPIYTTIIELEYA